MAGREWNLAMTTVTINSKTYKVIDSRTSESYRAAGHKNLADSMDKCGALLDLFITLPSGKVVYNVIQFKSGEFSRIERVARLTAGKQADELPDADYYRRQGI